MQIIIGTALSWRASCFSLLVFIVKTKAKKGEVGGHVETSTESGTKLTMALAEEQATTDLSSSVELSVDDLEIKVLMLNECFVYRIPKAQIGRE